MADDNTLRSYRSNDPYRRNTEPADSQDMGFEGSDPLAELARLIGQSDPYTDTRRQPQPATPRAAQRDEHGTGDWRRHIQRPDYETREEAPVDLDSRYASAEPRYTSAEPRARYADHDPYRMPSAQYDHHYGDPHADDRDLHADHRHDLHADHRHDSHADHGHDLHADHRQDLRADRWHDPHADYRHDPSYAAAAAHEYSDEQMYAAPPNHRGQAGGGQHGDVTAHADDDYDDPPRRKKTGSSLVTAVILIGCAMLGTAGAYGYRTYATSSGSKQAPVIIADNSPSKVVPEQKSTRSQERVAGQSSDEQLVSREEQPVSLQPPGNAGVPRVAFPSPVQPAPTTTGTTPSGSSNAPVSLDQPKRIPTIPIRPDGGDGSGRPFADAPSRAAPPPAARNAPPPAQRPAPNQPLSLDPGAQNPTAQNPSAQPSEPARPQQQPAPRVAALPPAGGNAGGYLVQVSSQRSEADAQASYRGLQSKYSQLKSHQPVIRRADLGDKGVYYRAMVGPFESGDQAVQFCNGLKQAGGQCIIHRN